RDDRHPRSRRDRGLGRFGARALAGVRLAPGVAYDPRGARAAFRRPPRLPVRAARPARRGGRGGAAAATRGAAMTRGLGAGLGAVLAIALHVTGPWALPLAAFVGALAAMALVYRLGLVGGAELDPRVLILAGVAVGAFASAITTAIVSLSEAAQLRNTFLWLWGGLSGASWDTVLVVCVYFPLPVAVLLPAARPLDLLALGEEPARHLGADVEPLRRRVYLAASLLTAAAVAVSGVIGFVGLIVPHAMRLLWGHRHRSLLPAS